jgi:hypothetical protein
MAALEEPSSAYSNQLQISAHVQASPCPLPMGGVQQPHPQHFQEIPSSAPCSLGFGLGSSLQKYKQWIAALHKFTVTSMALALPTPQFASSYLLSSLKRGPED